MFSDETYRAVIVAAIQAKGVSGDIPETIKETVDELIAADRKLRAYDNESSSATSENQKPDFDTKK